MSFSLSLWRDPSAILEALQPRAMYRINLIDTNGLYSNSFMKQLCTGESYKTKLAYDLVMSVEKYLPGQGIPEV